MLSRLRVLPTLLAVFTAFAYSARNVTAQNPIDFPRGLSFSAGFPAHGEDLCLDTPHCLQAYVYESISLKPLLQISRTSELDESNSQLESVAEAKKNAAALIERETQHAINVEAAKITARNTDYQISWMHAEIQARANQDNVPYGVAYNEAYNKLYYAQYQNIRLEVAIYDYEKYYHEFNATDFMPEYNKQIGNFFMVSEHRQVAVDRLFDIQFLKQLLLNLKIEYGPASEEKFNREYQAKVGRWHHLFFTSQLKFKGEPLHNGVTFSEEFARIASQVFEAAESEEMATFRMVMWTLAAAAVLGGAGFGMYSCASNASKRQSHAEDANERTYLLRV